MTIRHRIAGRRGRATAPRATARGRASGFIVATLLLAGQLLGIATAQVRPLAGERDVAVAASAAAGTSGVARVGAVASARGAAFRPTSRSLTTPGPDPLPPDAPRGVIPPVGASIASIAADEDGSCWPLIRTLGWRDPGASTQPSRAPPTA